VNGLFSPSTYDPDTMANDARLHGIEAWYDIKPELDKDSLNNVFTTTFVICLIGGWMYTFQKHAKRFAHKIALPLKALGRDMSAVSKLEFDNHQFVASTMIEIQYIQNCFAHMKNAIQSFSKYVPREIVLNMTMHRKMAQLGVQPRQISIFFSDIAGFTSICEQLAPTEVLLMLSEYFTAMSNIIVSRQGILLEFIGDAVLAIWGAPHDDPQHGMNCVTATLEMQNRLVEMREAWKAKGLPDIHIRCGLHTDEVFVGNLGAPNRMKYGVMGDGVNLASRLEELNKHYGTKILISDKTCGCFGVADTFVLRHVDRVIVKGRTKKTDLFEVMGEVPDSPWRIGNEGKRASDLPRVQPIADWMHEFVETYESGLDDYFNQDFNDAYSKFSEAHELRLAAMLKLGEQNEDLSCQMLMERCRAFIANPPPPEWDGVHHLTSK
jgi:adenylate cyclase